MNYISSARQHLEMLVSQSEALYTLEYAHIATLAPMHACVHYDEPGLRLFTLPKDIK